MKIKKAGQTWIHFLLAMIHLEAISVEANFTFLADEFGSSFTLDTLGIITSSDNPVVPPVPPHTISCSSTESRVTQSSTSDPVTSVSGERDLNNFPDTKLQWSQAFVLKLGKHPNPLLKSYNISSFVLFLLASRLSELYLK